MTIDDVLAVARALADRNRLSLGRALSELARRGFRSSGAVARRRRKSGAVFTVDRKADPITSEDVHRALNNWP